MVRVLSLVRNGFVISRYSQCSRLSGCEFSKKKIRVKVKLRLLNKNESKEKESFNCCTHITAIIIEYANDFKNIRKR